MRGLVVLALVLLPCLALGANLALNKLAFQSSIGWNGLASRAVDGNNNPQWKGLSCSHTLNAGNEWWAVDLGAVSNINSVRITNREDCCSERLANFTVGLTNISPEEQAPDISNYRECATVTDRIDPGEQRLITCSGIGRYLVIQLIPEDYLTLCEVQVFGEAMTGSEVVIEGTNLALKKPAFQSSMGWSGFASRAVDGNSNPQWNEASCSHTMNAGNEWWAVDLGAVSNINSVRITNRADCCSERLTNFTVGLTNISPEEQALDISNYRECSTVTDRIDPGEQRLITCSGIGRYLVIQLIPEDYLTLCEVEVFGDFIPEPEPQPAQKPVTSTYPTTTIDVLGPALTFVTSVIPTFRTTLPVPVTTPAPVSCPKQRAKFAENGLDVEPTFTETYTCEFALKQCNDDRCYCVSAKKGQRTYKNAEVPLGESYACDFKIKHCLKNRFKAIFKQQKTGEPADFVPVCTQKGKYEMKQCNNSGECWCAKPNKGKEIKNTRTTGDLKC